MHVFLQKIYKKIKNKALMTVTEYNYPIQWAQKIDKFGILKPLFKKFKIQFPGISEILL